MLYMVVGWNHSGKSIYGLYDDRKLAQDRKDSLDGHPYESYEVLPITLNKDCNI
jgi:hypothetical protein